MGTEYITSLNKNCILFRRDKQEIIIWTQSDVLATISEENTVGLAPSSEPPWVIVLSTHSLSGQVSLQPPGRWVVAVTVDCVLDSGLLCSPTTLSWLCTAY